MRTDRNIVYYCSSDRGHLVHLKCKEIREFTSAANSIKNTDRFSLRYSKTSMLFLEKSAGLLKQAGQLVLLVQSHSLVAAT